MRLSLLGGLAALLMSLPLVAEDKKEEKSEAKKDRKAQFAELKAGYEKQVADYRELMQGIKTQEQYEQKKDIVQEKQPKVKEFLPKVMELVEENPKDELSLEMLSLAVKVGDYSTRAETKKAIKYLTDAHATNPKIADVAMMLSSRSSADAKPLFDKIYAENENKEAKAFAAYGLASLAFVASDNAGAPAEQLKASTQEAEKYFEILAKDFADVKLGRRTMSEIAKRSLFDLRNLQIGMKAPEAACNNLAGKQEKLSDYKGKVVVLDIWATWCGPCRAMIPHEREMVKRLEGKPFALISVSADEEKEDLQKFLKKEEMPWNHWWAGTGPSVIEDWNVRFFPTIYVIDAKGVIRHKNLREEMLEEAVNKLVKEAEGQ